MSPEAQLLDLLDGLVMGLLGGRAESDAAGALAELSAPAAETARFARGLGMEASAIEAEAMAQLAEQAAVTAAAADLARLREALEQAVEQLQFTVESELAVRLSGGGGGEAPAAGGGAGPSAAPVVETMGEGGSMLDDFLLESREHLATIERELLQLERDPAAVEPVHAVFRGFHTIKGLAGICGLKAIRDAAHEVETLLDRVRNGVVAVDAGLIGRALAAADRLTEMIDEVGGQREGKGQNTGAKAEERAVVRAAQVVKVDLAKLDHLIDTVGELVISQSLVHLDVSQMAASHHRLARNLSQLGRITSDLQRTAMSLRVVPIGGVFQRMARLFRDLVQQCGKDAVLEVDGEDAELDRTIVEQLADPLMHMVRNAIDHGLETPAERAAAGKPGRGRVRLTASHHSGYVVIEMTDDGRGINREKVRERAVARGLVSADAAMHPQEILELIFLPGFSTAEKVTDVSGRGVGMDVVRRHIEQLRGRVEIRSVEGKGTTFLLRLPLTLAIIDGLVVRLAGVRYILPLFAVREIFRPGANAISTVEGRREVALIRDRVLPVLRLPDLLGLRGGRRSGESVMVVVELEGRRFGLMVDEVIGKQEVVIKNLGSFLGTVPGVFGGAILGDGSVGVILDVESLVNQRTNAVA